MLISWHAMAIINNLFLSVDVKGGVVSWTEVVEIIMGFLQENSADPFMFGVLFFLYSIAATVFLPIPIELGLFMNPGTSIWLKALILVAGKGAGAFIVFRIGGAMEGPVRGWSERWGWFNAIVCGCTLLVRKFRYIGLIFLLSIPFMTDTVPVYIFSIFQDEGNPLEWRWFVLASFVGGFIRALVSAFLFYVLGFNLWT